MINRKQKKWLKDNKFWYCKLDCSYYKDWRFINGSIGSVLLIISKRTLEAQIMGAGNLQPINYDEAIKLKDEWEKLNKENK
jgi:hypothetical protein